MRPWDVRIQVQALFVKRGQNTGKVEQQQTVSRGLDKRGKPKREQ